MTSRHRRHTITINGYRSSTRIAILEELVTRTFLNTCLIRPTVTRPPSFSVGETCVAQSNAEIMILCTHSHYRQVDVLFFTCDRHIINNKYLLNCQEPPRTPEEALVPESCTP